MKTTPTPLLALWTAVCMAMLAGNLDGHAGASENGVPVVEANVGVTLIVNDGHIVTVDRNDEGITFGEIVIPPAVSAQPGERDRVEREFLAWREQEMKARYEKAKNRSTPKSEPERP